MEAVYVIDALRTPVGRFGGALSTIRPDDLLAHVIEAIIKRNGKIDVNEIEDVIAGDANQAGEDNRNVPVWLRCCRVAGFCSGKYCKQAVCKRLQAIMDASRAIMCGDGNLFIAGGVESMTRAPFVMSKAEAAFSRKAEIYDTTIGWRFPNKKLTDKYYPYSMGETAENVARQWKISRHAQDEFAFRKPVKIFCRAGIREMER